ncbi:MAG TPA: TolC family protein, partial [Candidatus Melainabacteria bacterium]|nr:TolC family protein [Candidatus Melainabacteria bacterium]
FSGAVAGTGADIARGDGLQQIPLSSVTSAGSTLTPSIAGGANAPLANGIRGGRKTFDMRALFVLGMDVEWTLGGLGVTDTARVKRAGYVAREAQLAYNKELAKVYQEVRNSYNHAIDTEALVKETTSEVDSSEEALRIAVLRLKEGLGTQTDIIIAQRDYTQALINKVRAIIDYNQSQAQVLHSVGAISFNTLTRGFRPGNKN